MPLENPNFIEDFVLTNPTFQDFRSEGDDHLRNIKRAIKQTFPGLTGRAWRSTSASASRAVASTDNFSKIKGAGITLTPNAASVLGNGFVFVAQASGGSMTIDPAEPINGADTFVVPDGYSAFIFCDGSEFTALLVYKDVPPTTPSFPSGTRMVFQQTSAPAGWTKEVSALYNDATLRFTTSTVGTGGTDAFTTVFGAGKLTGGRAITLAQMASHAHNLAGGSPVLSGGGSDLGIPGAGGTNSQVYGSGATDSQGGGAAHDHPLTMNIKFCDLIVAQKQ